MITLTRQILVSAPKDSVKLYLRDLQNLPHYEHKVDSAEVSYPDAESGLVEVSGKFLGLPWRGAIQARFTRDGGYRSEIVRGPLPRMAEGYHLRPVLGGTLLTHEEEYYFPWFLRPLAPLLKGRLLHRMDKELGVIKEGAEKLHRKIQLEKIEQAL